MKQLNEMFEGNELSTYLQNVNEGVVGDFFKKTFNYLKGKIAEIGKYFVALFKDGSPLDAMTPITSQVAVINGDIKDKGVHWIGTKEDAKYSHVSTDAMSLLKYRDSDTLKFWKSKRIRESALEDIDKQFKINEDLKLANDDKQIPAVDGSQLKTLIRSALLSKRSMPLLIWGAPGVGKTQVVNAVLKEVQGSDARLLDFQLSLKEHDDFFLPAYEVNDRGEKTAAIDLPKSYLPVYKPCGDPAKDKAADEACGRGLIFLDELTQAKPSVQAVMLKLVQDRALGEDYKLGSGWAIIAAANREADEVGAQEFNKALGNRFAQVNYEPTVKSWREWADKKGYMNKHVLNWLEEHEKYFYFASDPDTTLFATPRTWERACLRLSEFANTAEEEGFDLMDIPDDIILLSLTMEVGREAAMAFMEYVKLMRTIDMNDLRKVFTDPMKAPLPKKEGSTYKVDMLYIITTQLISMLKKAPTAQEFENLATYIGRLQNESACGKFLRAIVAKFPEMSEQWGEITDDKGNPLPGHDKYVKGLQIIIDAYPRYENAEEINW